jgi:hypothetical protein
MVQLSLHLEVHKLHIWWCNRTCEHCVPDKRQGSNRHAYPLNVHALALQ